MLLFIPVVGGLFTWLISFIFLAFVAAGAVVGFVILAKGTKAGLIDQYCRDVEEKLLKINPVHPSLGRFKKSGEAIVRTARSSGDASVVKILENILPDALRAYEALRRNLDDKKRKETAGEDTAEVDRRIEKMTSGFESFAGQLESWATDGVKGITDTEAEEMFLAMSDLS